MRPSRVLAAFFLAMLATTNAGAQEAPVKERGLVLAREVCFACHAILASDPITTAPPPSFRAIAESSGMSEAALGVFLRSPHINMPNLVLSAAEIRDVAAYIMSLKGSR